MNRTKLLATLRVIASRRMLVAFLMGFSSGLPLLLTLTLLQAWLTLNGISIAVIGLFALVGLPYTFKFIWSPIFDRYRMPFLGRRRGWLLVIQLILAATIVALGLTGVPNAAAENAANPAWIFAGAPFAPPLAHLPQLMTTWIGSLGSILPGLSAVALVALLVAFFSASQDTLIDAYRRESLADDNEQAFGASLYTWGYRLAMLFAGGIGLILAYHLSFRNVFFIMAASMIVGIVATLIAHEPRAVAGKPTTLARSVIDPFIAFFRAYRWHKAPPMTNPAERGVARIVLEGGLTFFKAYWPALALLAFILLYKLGDALASNLAVTYLIKLGFTTETIGVVDKLFGFWALMAGILVGGLLVLKLGMRRGLLLFGIFQGAGTAAFAWLSYTGADAHWLAGVVSLVKFSDGMGTAALVGFMATLTDRRFTVTQFALLTSLASVPRVIISSFTGFMAASLGWPLFFIVCALAAIPGLALIPVLPTQTPDKAEP